MRAKEIKFFPVEFRLGVIYLCKLEGKLVWAEFERKGSKPFTQLIKMEYTLKEDLIYLEKEVSAIKRYFQGERTDFSEIPVSFIIGTEKEKMVWKELSKIPYGTTVTYSYIAERIGIPGASRFVGNAVGKNPLPIIIPCHRVIRKNGSLGGFSAGLHIKKYLLDLESASI